MALVSLPHPQSPIAPVALLAAPQNLTAEDLQIAPATLFITLVVFVLDVTHLTTIR